MGHPGLTVAKSCFNWICITHVGEQRDNVRLCGSGLSRRVAERFDKHEVLGDGISSPIWGLPVQRLVKIDELESHCMECTGSGEPKGEHTLVIRLFDDTDPEEKFSKNISVSPYTWGVGRQLSEGLFLVQKALEYLELCETAEPSAKFTVRQRLASEDNFVWADPEAEVPHPEDDTGGQSRVNSKPQGPVKQQEEVRKQVFPLKNGCAKARAAVAMVAIIDLLVGPNVTVHAAIRQVANLACCLTAPTALAAYCVNKQKFLAEVEVEGSIHARRLLFELRVTELPGLPENRHMIFSKHKGSRANFDNMIRCAAEGYNPCDPLLVELQDSARKDQNWRNGNSRSPSLDGLVPRTRNSQFITPFYTDYGFNVVARDVFLNYAVVTLDSAPIYLSPGSGLGPAVNVYTCYSPLRPGLRRSGILYTAPVEIASNAIVFGNSTIYPGVRIGENSVIAAGSVVTGDVPANSLFAGNPARFVREVWDGHVIP